MTLSVPSHPTDTLQTPVLTDRSVTRTEHHSKCNVILPERAPHCFLGLPKDSGRRDNTVLCVARASSPWSRYAETIGRTRPILPSLATYGLLTRKNSALTTIDRVRSIVSVYQNHGLEARATSDVTRTRRSGHTRFLPHAHSTVGMMIVSATRLFSSQMIVLLW